MGKKYGWVLLFLFLPHLSYGQEQESLAGVFETLSDLAIGIYTGITPKAGEITLNENSDTGVSSLMLANFGILAKYRFGILFFRSGFQGAITLFGGRGKINNSDFIYDIQELQIPLVFGLQFPLTRKSALYLGYGGSYILGIFQVENHLANNTYLYQSFVGLYVIGAEFSLTDNGFFVFEWQKTAGSTGVLGNATFAERELSLNNHQFLVGYQYYFRF